MEDGEKLESDRKAVATAIRLVLVSMPIVGARDLLRHSPRRDRSRAALTADCTRLPTADAACAAPRRLPTPDCRDAADATTPLPAADAAGLD